MASNCPSFSNTNKIQSFLNTYLQHNPGFSFLHSRSPNSETRQPEFNVQLLQSLALWSRQVMSLFQTFAFSSHYHSFGHSFSSHLKPSYQKQTSNKPKCSKKALQSLPHYVIHNSNLQMKTFYTEQIITGARSGG